MRVNDEHVTHPDRAFRFLRFETAGFAGPRHRHPQLELTWIEEGSGVRFVGDSAAPFASGDLVLLGPLVPHAWLGTGAGDVSIGRVTVVQFPLALLEHPLLPELACLRPLSEQAGRGLAIGGACHAAVTGLLAAMPQADALARLGSLLGILRCLCLHPADLQPLATSPMRSAGPAGSERRIDRVIDWVHRHLHEDLDPQAAARVAHVSQAAFSRFFHRETGKTWSVYLNDVRCSQACVLLKQSGAPISAVAQACGYRTMSHFNAEFRARYGRTPREHRRGPFSPSPHLPSGPRRSSAEPAGTPA
jgi:AraC-like DNA-binding protein